MAGAIQLTEVDFDQIKNNLIDYLKSTKQFSDYDFDGSNLQMHPEPDLLSGSVERLQHEYDRQRELSGFGVYS